METYGYIYITTNTINGKRYIGQHKHKEWDSNYIGSGKLLKWAIKKYGKENFTCFPLAWAWNKDELNQLEIEYITHYKPEYNLTKGGQEGNLKNKRCFLSEEHKLKIRNSLMGHKHSENTKRKIGQGNKGKIVSEETLRKISESRKLYRHSDDTKRKMSEAHKGIIPWNKGKHHSEETKRKMKEKRILYSEKRKAA
jgi:group I intron endonuclease